MWSLSAEMMMRDILEATRQENEVRRTGTIEFIIVGCLKPVYEWLQALFWGKGEPHVEPFNVSGYLQRREELLLEFEEERRTEYTIVLWLGYDGLRLNKDGSFEWISRKKPEPVSCGALANASYLIDYSGCQNAQATREQLFGLRMQLEMENFNAALQNQMQGFNSALQSYVIQTPAYPGYLYAGKMQSPLTGCCSQTILR